MSKSKRNQKSQRRTSRQASASVPPDILFTLLKAAVAMLLMIRLLVPTESAAQGDTLWIVQLWLAAGLLWAWHCDRHGNSRVRLNLLDLLLWVVVLGHAISALSLIATEGHKRAALNMTWEWVGLGVTFFLVRQTIRTQAERRRVLLALVVTTASLSGLGIWQHYVSYPNMVGDYDRMRSELDGLEEKAATPSTAQESAARARRIGELRLEFSSQNIPLEGPARALFEQRLRSSSEPFGLFALANTFAGLLIVGLIVGLALLAGAWQHTRTRTELFVAVLAVGLIAFCLVLTKSRTAWAGLLAGLATWGWLLFRRGASPIHGRWLMGALVGGVTLAALLTGAGLSGGLDRKVLEEAPKSLKYRVQYWSGSWGIVREHPILGIGPGNFRQHYLRHKAAESSEEIADPHNLILDVWTSGGIVALAGLLGLLVVGLGRVLRRNPTGETLTDRAESSTESSWPDALIAGAGLSFFVVFGADWILAAGADFRLLVLPAVWVGLFVFLRKIANSVEVSDVSLYAATVALLVHLLGAGGIEMPAISQTFLLLLALGNMPETPASETVSEQSRVPVLVIGATMFLLSAVCAQSATGPVLYRTGLIQAGEHALLAEQNLRKAERLFQEAAEKDPFSPEPVRRRAELLFQRWQRSQSDLDFQRAVEIEQVAIELDPHSAQGYRRLGEWFLEKFNRTHSPDDAETAADSFMRAVDRYPQHAALRSELAESLEKSGKSSKAVEQAEFALRLHEINVREGHADKYLPSGTLSELKRIANPGSDRELTPNPN